MGDWHPESPDRLDAINDRLIASGLLDFLDQANAEPAGDADLLRVHTQQHLDFLRRHAPASGYFQVDPDTSMNPHTLSAAMVAAGAGIGAVDAVMEQKSATAFCAVRPPGHHACSDRAMGFCFFNNLAVAVAYTLERYGLDRVAIIDFDVHHGNGTEEIFSGDNRVQMYGFFQDNIFPGVHAVNKAENMLNIPVGAYSTGEVVRDIVSSNWLPHLKSFAPQFIFISAGFDAHRDDDLAQLGLVEDDYRWITEQLVSVADQTAQGRIVSFLEGGYDLQALGRSVEAHVRALAKL